MKKGMGYNFLYGAVREEHRPKSVRLCTLVIDVFLAPLRWAIRAVLFLIIPLLKSLMGLVGLIVGVLIGVVVLLWGYYPSRDLIRWWKMPEVKLSGGPWLKWTRIEGIPLCPGNALILLLILFLVVAMAPGIVTSWALMLFGDKMIALKNNVCPVIEFK